MTKKRSSPQQIIMKLREAEVLLSQDQMVKQVCQSLEISTRKLKELERQNTRLKKLVADLSLDNAILKEVLSKK